MRAAVVAAEVEAATGPEVPAAAGAGLPLGLLLGIDEMDASLAVSSAVDVALGARRRWSAADRDRFEGTFPSALRHFLAHARGDTPRVSPLTLAILCEGGAAPPPVNEAVSAVAVAGDLGARVLSDRPAVIHLVVAVCRCLSLMPPEGAAGPRVDRETVDLCLLRAGLRWRRAGAPPPMPSAPARLWRPGSEETAFDWACARRVEARPGVEAIRAPLEAAVAELLAAGIPRNWVDFRAGELATQLP